MAWFKIDDGFWAHPKTLQLTDSAVALWVRAGAWSCQQLTDGFIPQYALPMLGVDEFPALQLVEVGYWDVSDGGYTFHDWDEYQEASEAVKDRRKKNAEKMRRWRDAKAAKQGGNQASNPVSDPVTLPVTNQVSNPLPDPTRPDPTSLSTTAPAVRVSEADFERAWSHWPKKVERKKSLEKFKAAVKRRGLEELISDIARFGDAYARHSEKQFTPALNVWLNGERWTDELPGAQAARVEPAMVAPPAGKRWASDVINDPNFQANWESWKS